MLPSIVEIWNEGLDCKQKAGRGPSGIGVVRQPHLGFRFARAALGDDQCDVVLLLVGAVAAHLVEYSSHEQPRRQTTMASQTIQKAMLTELFAVAIKGLGDTVGVEHQRVTCEKPGLANRTFPLLEESEDGGGGVEALQMVIAAEKQGRQMPAIGVTQTPGLIVVFRKKEGSVRPVGCVLAEEAVNGSQKEFGLVDRHG